MVYQGSFFCDELAPIFSRIVGFMPADLLLAGSLIKCSLKPLNRPYTDHFSNKATHFWETSRGCIPFVDPSCQCGESPENEQSKMCGGMFSGPFWLTHTQVGRYLVVLCSSNLADSTFQDSKIGGTTWTTRRHFQLAEVKRSQLNSKQFCLLKQPEVYRSTFYMPK